MQQQVVYFELLNLFLLSLLPVTAADKMKGADDTDVSESVGKNNPLRACLNVCSLHACIHVCSSLFGSR